MTMTGAMRICADCGSANQLGDGRRVDCGTQLHTAGGRHWRRPDWLARALALVLALVLLGGGVWYSTGLFGVEAGPPCERPQARERSYPMATFAPLVLGSPPPAPRAVVQGSGGVPAGRAGVAGDPGIPIAAPTPLLASVPTAGPTDCVRTQTRPGRNGFALVA